MPSTPAQGSPLAPEWLSVPADINELHPGIWSDNAVREQDGVVHIAGVSVTELAGTYGTPLYVMDEADVRARAWDARDAFDRETARIGTTARVYYASKAFLCAEVARWVTEAGLGVDVASGGEFALALAVGVDPAVIGLHGNNKSIAEIQRAVDAGVGAIVVDSVIEVERIAAAARRASVTQKVRLRVNSGVHAHTHDYLATAREDQKFGITLADAPAVVAQIRAHHNLAFLGLHCHIGSQISGLDGFSESARRLLALHAELLRGGTVPELNLGGGFGIRYTEADDALSFSAIAAGLADIVAAECARLQIAVPQIAVEPGRAIVGPSTATLYEVGTVKPVTVEGGAVRTYVGVDGGMSDNARPALYEADYGARVVGRRSQAPAMLARVVGKHCESGDIVVNADYLPADVFPGDLLATPATGAYCWSLSSNYNFVPRPAVVAVLDGRSRLLVRADTEHDLLSRDAGLAPADESTNG